MQAARLPAAPPVTALGEKAPTKIERNANGTASIFLKITIPQRKIYIIDIKGTNFSVMEAILVSVEEMEK